MNEKKQEIRNRIWKKLNESGQGAFPFPLEGRIPNFRGSNTAAKLLSEQDFWKKAHIIKSNPDSPQKRVRELALRDGKKVFMAVPKLRTQKPFRELDPSKIDNFRKATSIKGSSEYGEPVYIEEMPELDLIIAGSVAVHRDGRRIGKGGGYSDIEFALATKYGKVTEGTVIVTTVHPVQVIDEDIPIEPHDIPVDYIITPEEVIRTETAYNRPGGIIPGILSEEYRNDIPCLSYLDSQL